MTLFACIESWLSVTWHGMLVIMSVQKHNEGFLMGHGKSWLRNVNFIQALHFFKIYIYVRVNSSYQLLS